MMRENGFLPNKAEGVTVGDVLSKKKSPTMLFVSPSDSVKHAIDIMKNMMYPSFP